jgi:hypothetical protein
MPMSDPQPVSERLFNNADSFAHAFDLAWSNQADPAQDHPLDKDEKLGLVLARIADHPFALNDPTMARQVAEFRLRLLGL